MIITFCSLIFLTGCAKDITQADAGGIATTYLINQIGIEEPIVVHQVILKQDGWHVQVMIGDDEGTVILDRKGEFVTLEAYTWV
ncbi:hypothetical protein COV17_03180 [Candidatus Woesearchaeota archaeon CG10_big_fil_rev_8_21_14_0_10_36_11]|nr:MAG: hypothetical protein COV17_03180 [Candidatus Woesearchaeota archaeon CG10_big_fil_rev_8_21_14_0_10_36_11]